MLRRFLTYADQHLFLAGLSRMLLMAIPFLLLAFTAIVFNASEFFQMPTIQTIELILTFISLAAAIYCSVLMFAYDTLTKIPSLYFDVWFDNCVISLLLLAIQFCFPTYNLVGFAIGIVGFTVMNCIWLIKWRVGK